MQQHKCFELHESINPQYHFSNEVMTRIRWLQAKYPKWGKQNLCQIKISLLTNQHQID